MKKLLAVTVTVTALGFVAAGWAFKPVVDVWKGSKW